MNEEQNKKIVKEYFEGWSGKQKDKIRLAPGMKHISCMARYESAESFLGDCWDKYSGIPIEIKGMIADGDTVCAWYTMPGPEGELPVTEWISLENGLIEKIRVFMDKPHKK